MVIGLVGTTIAPWMQFYLQASIVEKGVTARQYAASRWDVILGCLFTDVVAWFIIVACAATLHCERAVTTSSTRRDAAQALRPLAGEYAYLLFAAGLFNASLFAASILPISTAYAVCEGLGLESGLDKKFDEAPALLLAVHPVDRVRRAACCSCRGLPLFHVDGAVAGRQRRAAAVRADLHAAADQRPRADGRARQLARHSTSSPGSTVVVMIVLTILMVLTQR